jgi:SAM-dependent methyltransferase
MPTPPSFVAQVACQVCGGASQALDVVDFSKSCEEARGKFLPLSGVPIYYHLCRRCGFCFAPEFGHWSLGDFEQRIYNDDYVQVDPDYLRTRPLANANNLIAMFGGRPLPGRHLDYGGGSGLLSRTLVAAGWRSSSYDPFVDRDVEVQSLGKFELITAFEVFEHVPDVRKLMAALSSLLQLDGIVLFSTLISDGNLAPQGRIQWWYASPRNGHISLFSRNSLALLCNQSGYLFGSFNEGFHVFWKTIPPWASHLVQAPQN